MNASEHARQAPAPGAAQFERCSMCRGPSHDEFCMNGASRHRTVTDGECQVLREIGYTLSTRQTSWPENMGTAICVFRAPLGKGTALHVSRVPNWTPRVRLQKTISTQQVASGCCAECAWIPFFWNVSYVTSCLLNLDHREMIY